MSQFILSSNKDYLNNLMFYYIYIYIYIYLSWMKYVKTMLKSIKSCNVLELSSPFFGALK